VKQPWWYLTKTESQAFWVGGLNAAVALIGWVGAAMGDLVSVGMIVVVVWWTLMACAYLTSGVVRRRLSARSTRVSRWRRGRIKFHRERPGRTSTTATRSS
jgi:hypothetical protein